MLKIAVVGFRHGHIMSLVQHARKVKGVEIVAMVEEDPSPEAREYVRQMKIELTHETFDQVLDGVEFDALITGDYFARRGTHIIKALRAGKHVHSDKPMCTWMEELREIARLSREKNLFVTAALTMRYLPVFATVRRLVRDGGIGELCNGYSFGVHGLAYRSGRPMWFFEEGKQQGTINDLLVHGIDMIRWCSGRELVKVIAGTVRNMSLSEVPWFQDSAQAFYELDNGGKYFGDCSYLAPPRCPSHWVFEVWGTAGRLHFDSGGDLVYHKAGKGPVAVKVDRGLVPVANCVEDWARRILSGAEPVLSREDSVQATAAALAAQEAAERGVRDVAIPKIM
jgi:predicted dehydrogenase